MKKPIAGQLQRVLKVDRQLFAFVLVGWFMILGPEELSALLLGPGVLVVDASAGIPATGKGDAV